MEATIDNIEVMYVLSENGVKGARKAFSTLESKLLSLKKRKFYGASFGPPETGEYRACVKITEGGDNPKEMGVETWTIPGGKYEKRKLKDWEQNIHLIGSTFSSMFKEVNADNSRPAIGFYRSQKELILMVPIK